MGPADSANGPTPLGTGAVDNSVRASWSAELERVTRGRLAGQYDAETHALSRWRHKRPRLHQAPPPQKKRPRFAAPATLEPPEDMRPMEIPLEDWGDAIILTGLTSWLICCRHHPRHGTDSGDARRKTRSKRQPTLTGLREGAPEGLTLNVACQRTFAVLCERIADTWWNNRFGLRLLGKEVKWLHTPSHIRIPGNTRAGAWLTWAAENPLSSLDPSPYTPETHRSPRR